MSVFDIKLDALNGKIEAVDKKIDVINCKLDEYLIIQAQHNNAFYECRGNGKTINKLVFILLSLMLAGQIFSAVFYFKDRSNGYERSDTKTEVLSLSEF